MEEDLISVIIPVYNVEKYIERCIESITRQTYTNLEIIIIDDGSKDNSKAICQKLENKDKRIKIYSQENKGAAAARNYGISKANGEYIGFVDSDDYIEEKMYEELIHSLKENNADIAICGRYIENKDNNIVYTSKENRLLMTSDEALSEVNSLKSFDMSPCDKLYKRAILNEVKFPEGKNSEDFYFMYEALFNCEKIFYFSNPLYHYCRRENSHSNYCINNSYIEASKAQVEFFKKNCPHLLYIAECYDAYANTIQYNKYICAQNYCPKEIIKELKESVRRNKKSVIKNKNFPTARKVQIFMFLYFTFIYKCIIKRKGRK